MSLMSLNCETGQKSIKPLLPAPIEFPATISVFISIASLKDTRITHIAEVKTIAEKTGTHIESYEVPQFGKIKFCIFGKWRNCLHAGRLLWYSVIRETTVYIHSVWERELNKPLADQNGTVFRTLYKRVSYKQINEYSLIAMSGPCWDVLKSRKELIKRRKSAEESESSNNMINTKLEIMALQILQCIRTDIRDDINFNDSIYSLRHSHLLELLMGQSFGVNLDESAQIFGANDSRQLGACFGRVRGADIGKIQNQF